MTIRSPLGTSLLPALLTLAIHVSAPKPVDARINVGDSIEWLCESRPHIAIMEVTLPADLARNPKPRALSNAIARTSKVLKGLPPAEAVIDCYGGVRVRPGGAASLIAFFDEAMRVDYAIALDDSESCIPWAAITADFRVLRRPSDMIAAVESRLERLLQARKRTSKPRSLLVYVPDRTAAFWVLFDGSATFLTVPADSEYRSGLLRNLRSEDVELRTAAAWNLGTYYPGRATVTTLRALFVDTTMDTVEGKSYFPVRQAAYLALRNLRIDGSRPEGYIDNPSIRRIIRDIAENNPPTMFRR